MRSELPTLVGGIGLDSGLGLDADSLRGPVVGREAEMHLLAQALERTRVRGEPASITLLGPKDAGKTRVLQAFAEGARKLDSPAVRVMQCAAHDGDARYGVFARLLRERFELRDQMTDEEVRSELRARVADVLGDRKVGDVLYFLGRMLDVHFPDSPITRAIDHGTAEFEVVSRAVARSFFEADARRGPLCLVIEDVHLCEDESLALLRFLVESVDAPFFVVCSARTELLGRAIAWARSERHKLVHLSPQTHDETAVAARIAVLLPEELALLEGAALMGSVFWGGALVALERASMTAPAFWDPQNHEPMARRLLASLAERDYVLKLPDSTFPGDEEYIFKHSLEREKISNSTSPDTARHLARIVADWLERQPALRDYEENLCMLAGHRQRAGMLAAAGRAFLEAGDVAKKRDAVTAAADCYSKGLALLGEEESGSRLEALRSLSAILVRQGKSEAALRRFGEMAALAFRLNAPAVGAEAHAGIARLDANAGDAIGAVRHMRAAVGLYAQAGADDAVGSAAAELDKLMDQIAAASVRHGESKVNGTSGSAPVEMATASDFASATASASATAAAAAALDSAALDSAAAGAAAAAAAVGAATAAAGEMAGSEAASATPDTGAADTPSLEEASPASFEPAVDSSPTLVKAVDARRLDAAIGGGGVEATAAAIEDASSEARADVSTPLADASAEERATAPAMPAAPDRSGEAIATPQPMLSTFDTGSDGSTVAGPVEAAAGAMVAAESESMAVAEGLAQSAAVANVWAASEQLSGAEYAAQAESVPTQRAPVPLAALDAKAALDEASTSDRPTPPAPFPAAAALAAESAEGDSVTRGSGKFDAGTAAARSGEVFDDDVDAVDIDLSEESDGDSVADWIDLKGSDPAMTAVRSADAPARTAATPIEPSSDGADSDIVPTMRRVLVASDASLLGTVFGTQPDAEPVSPAAESPPEELQATSSSPIYDDSTATSDLEETRESAPRDDESAAGAAPPAEAGRDAPDADRDAGTVDADRHAGTGDAGTDDEEDSEAVSGDETLSAAKPHGDALPGGVAWPNADTLPSGEALPASEGRPSADTLPSVGTGSGSTENIPPGESEYGISPPSGDLEEPESK